MVVTGPKDFFQARQRSLRIRLRVRGGIHILCVSSVQHSQYEEIERQRHWKRLCWKRRQPSSGSRRKRDNFAEKTPSKIGCFQGLWHWGQFTGKSVVTLTLTSKWSMSRSWTQRYLVCADSKFLIRSPEVTQEPWVKFNTSRRGIVDGIKVLGRVGNKKRIGIDSLY